jgi:hypothetical protein
MKWVFVTRNLLKMHVLTCLLSLSIWTASLPDITSPITVFHVPYLHVLSSYFRHIIERNCLGHWKWRRQMSCHTVHSLCHSGLLPQTHADDTVAEELQWNWNWKKNGEINYQRILGEYKVKLFIMSVCLLGDTLQEATASHQNLRTSAVHCFTILYLSIMLH